ncbi:MAG: efflux RND transporter periplasmic adaptor subunit [Bdellovibrionia bacterium]
MIRIALLALILASAGCTRKKEGVSEAQLYRSQRENISKVITVPGKISTANKIVITAPLGNKIKVLNVQLGQRVKKGTILLEYDQTAILNDVSRLRNEAAQKGAEIRNSELRIQGLKKKLDSAKLLFSKKVAAAKDVEDAQRELESAYNTLKVHKLEVDTSKTLLSRAEENLKNLRVSTPISGTITSLWLGSETFVPGSTVKEGDKLVTVSDMENIIINGKLSETDSFLVNPSQRVEIRLDSLAGFVFQGRILGIDPTPEVDQTTGVASIPIRMMLMSNDPRIRVGMNAQCDIVLNAKANALVVPLNAIKHDGNSEYVEVLDRGALTKRPVRLGVTNDVAAEIASGLADGEIVRVP